MLFLNDKEEMVIVTKQWALSNMYLLLLCSIIFSGCVGQNMYQQTYRTLSVTKETLIFVGKTSKQLHAQGLISDVAIAKIRDAYERASAAQNAVIELQKEVLDTEERQERVLILTGVYLRAVTELVNLAIDVGILRADDERIREGDV